MRITRIELSYCQTTPCAGEGIGMPNRELLRSNVFRRHITRNIDLWILRQLVEMARVMGLRSGDETCSVIHECALGYLEVINSLINANAIRPWRPFRAADSDIALPPARYGLRIGIFPTDGNPLHWGHLLCGLAAIALLKLDKVVYVIAGRDRRKPHLMPEGLRHSMAKELLSGFMPLFVYSPIARCSSRDGETSLFRILDLNPGLEIETVYYRGPIIAIGSAPSRKSPTRSRSWSGTSLSMRTDLILIRIAFGLPSSSEGVRDRFRRLRWTSRFFQGRRLALHQPPFEKRCIPGAALNALPHFPTLPIANCIGWTIALEDCFAPPVQPQTIHAAYTLRLKRRSIGGTIRYEEMQADRVRIFHPSLSPRGDERLFADRTL